MSGYDSIVIGAGVNGMVAAGLLAKRGKKVLILERRDVVGGVAAGEEFYEGFTSPGLLHDTTGLRGYVVAELGLLDHGLKLLPARPSVYLPRRGGGGIMLHGDHEKTAKNLEAISAEDAAGYRSLQELFGDVRRVIRPLLDEAPMETETSIFGKAMELLPSALRIRLLGSKQMSEVLRVFPMCVADLVGEHVKDELLRAGLCSPGIYGTWMGPWSPGSATTLAVWEATAGPSVVGGPRALVSALQKMLASSKAEVRTGAEVIRLRVEKGRVTGVVLKDDEELAAKQVVATCAPRVTFRDLLDPLDVGADLGDQIENFRVRGTTAKLNLALDGPLPLPGHEGGPVAYVRTGEHVDEIERAFDAVKYRTFSRRPVLEIYQPTVEDPSLAPEGKHVLSVLVHYAPYELDEGWSETTANLLADRALEALEEFCPGVGALVRGREILTPLDLEERYGLPGGQIHHGEHSIDQFVLRPVPACARYETPLAGLYLGGAGSHPGGGVTGAPGYLAARAME